MNNDRFLSLITPLMPNLERFVRASLGKNRSYVADIDEIIKDTIQETVVITFEKFSTIRHEKALLSFMFTVASRLIQKLYRHRFRYAELTPSGEEEEWIVSAEESCNANDVERLYEQLDTLPFLQREAIILFEIMGYSLKEILEIQGGTMIALKVRLSRGRKQLEQYFSE